MAITRWNNSFRGLGTIHQELDDIFSEILDQSSTPMADNLPTMDIYIEDDQRLVAEVHLPGFSPEDVEIRALDDVLEVRGEKNEEVEDENLDQGRSYILRQSVTRFFRRIVLPTNADTEHIDATFDDGILRIVVPFTRQPEAKRVTVNANNTSGTRRVRSSNRTTGRTSKSDSSDKS